MTRWTERSLPDLADRTYLVTGANSGIGFEAGRALAQAGATVIMGCRNRSKAEQAADEITATSPAGSVEILDMDLADLDSVRAGAESVLSGNDRLDGLINNAGLMATPRQRTAQGFEMQFGVNHLAHFALTGHLIDLLMSSGTDALTSSVPGARVVSVSSQGHRLGRMNFDDLTAERSYQPWPAYFQSKLANLLFTRELQRRLDRAEADVLAVAAHPGLSATNLGHQSSGGVAGIMMQLTRPWLAITTQSAAMGALPTLRAATDPAVEGGDYYGPSGPGEMRGHPVKVGMAGRARSDRAAERLWTISEDLTGVGYLS